MQNLRKFNMIFRSALYKKRYWNITGGYDINMVAGFEGWEFWISMLKNEREVKN